MQLYILKVWNYSDEDREGNTIKHYITYSFPTYTQVLNKIDELEANEYEVIDLDDDTLIPLIKVIAQGIIESV